MQETHENFSRPEEKAGSSDRSFGLVFTAAFALIALSPLRHGNPVRIWALVVSGVFLLLALTIPAVLHPLNLLWSRFGLLLSKVTNPIILGVMFFVVLTPVAFFARLFGKDLLRLRSEPGTDSYWIPRLPPGPAPESMRNQF